MVLDSDWKQLKASMNSFPPYKETLICARHLLPNKMNLTIASWCVANTAMCGQDNYMTELNVLLYVACTLY